MIAAEFAEAVRMAQSHELNVHRGLFCSALQHSRRRLARVQ